MKNISAGGRGGEGRGGGRGGEGRGGEGRGRGGEGEGRGGGGEGRGGEGGGEGRGGEGGGEGRGGERRRGGEGPPSDTQPPRWRLLGGVGITAFGRLKEPQHPRKLFGILQIHYKHVGKRHPEPHISSSASFPGPGLYVGVHTFEFRSSGIRSGWS